MQPLLQTLGISVLAMMASTASLQKTTAERRTKAPEARRVVDAGSGEPIAAAEQIASGSQLLIRAPGYQEVRIATMAGTKGRREIALCPLAAADSDGDGLCDLAEQRYHTDVDSADTDQDAISDRIETYGEALPDGSAFSPEAYGASPAHRDVFVYVNWTKRWPVKQAALDLVVDAFAHAPKGTNTDETIGINVHFLLGGEITYADDLPYTEPELAALRQKNFPYPVSFPFHYLILSDYMQGRDASGISPSIPGENFIVTLSGVKNLTLLGEAGTIMHELGHNLGLLHGGSDDDNFKPHYLSVMNYLYQFDGLQRNQSDDAPRVLDYARFGTDVLDEGRLNETAGFPVTSAADNDLVTHYHPLFCRKVGPGKRECLSWGWITGTVPGALDFNGNGQIDKPSLLRRLRGDLNGDGLIAKITAGRNDWATLSFNPRSPGNSRVVTELSACPLPTGPAAPVDGPLPLLDDAPSDDPTPTEPTDAPDQPEDPAPAPAPQD